MFLGSEADPDCFRVAIEAGVKHFARDDYDDGTDVELSEEAAGATVEVASLVLKMATADPLGSLLAGLPLCQCIT